MVIGYIRVSTKDQNLERQQEIMKRYGIEKIYEEKISGKNMERPALKDALDFVREGDKLVVTELSRLGRSARDLLNIVDSLEKKGIVFCSVKENIDTSTPTGKLMKTILCALSEYERDIILERQREGINVAKNKGVYKGRKPVDKPCDFDKIADSVYKDEITAVEAMKKTGLKKAVFYKFYNTYKKSVEEEG